MDKRAKKGKKGNVALDQTSKTTEPSIQDTAESPLQTTDGYQCTGNLEVDFQKMCALAGIAEIPLKEAKQPKVASPSAPSSEKEGSKTEISANLMTTWNPRPYLHVEMQNEDPQSVKKVKIAGWKVDEVMAQVLSKVLPSLSSLQILQMWQTGLTDSVLNSLKNTIFMCSNLRTVILEGNPLPEQSYHILMGEGSMIVELSLRNNHISDEGACLIGSALSTPYSTNRSLLSLNMAFNSIGDAGAMYIAQGLRWNRSLLYLCLANNHIGDSGAAHLAGVLNSFALTHEEIVERRKQMIKRDQMDPPPKDEILSSSQKVSTLEKKEELKMGKRINSDNAQKLSHSLRGKLGGKDKQSTVSVQESEEVAETLGPLLNPHIQRLDGKLIMPGNKILTSLNLAGNKLTQQSVKMFLLLLEGQGEKGLLRLILNRNRFPPDCEDFLKIQEILSLKDKTKPA